jgi:hypothetical protein
VLHVSDKDGKTISPLSTPVVNASSVKGSFSGAAMPTATTAPSGALADGDMYYFTATAAITATATNPGFTLGESKWITYAATGSVWSAKAVEEVTIKPISTLKDKAGLEITSLQTAIETLSAKLFDTVEW